MPTLRVPEVEVTQAVLRLASIQDQLPPEVVADIQLLIDAVDERGSKLFQIAKDARDMAFRDDIYGTFINSNRILIVLERLEQL